MSMSRSLSRMTAGFPLAALLLLAGCGGGGGSDGQPPSDSDPVVYVGSTSQAVTTTTNASKLTANVIGSGDTATAILGISIESSGATQNPGSGLMDLAQRLSRPLRDIVVRAERASSARRQAPAVQVNDVEPCDSNIGSVSTSGTLSDVNFTGTLAVSFNGCLIDGVTLNGTAMLRVDHFEFAMQRPTDFTLSFSRLTLRGSGLSIDAGGSLRWLLTGTGCCGVGVTFERYTITANIVSQDKSTGKTTKTEPLAIMNEERLTSTSTSLTMIVSGRVFDPDHGYVDITTPTPLFFDTVTQLFPNSGQMLLTGTGNRSVRVTALSATLATLALDLDGNGVPENTATVKWTDLTGPVGADLGDADGDGMHNSWETVNGLNPGLDDAAGDKDGDLITNINEYLAGTNP